MGKENAFKQCFHLFKRQYRTMYNEKSIFMPKQKRAYHSILSGLMFARYGNKDIRFLTLTTSDEMANMSDFDKRTLNKNFQVFRKRVIRTSPQGLLDDGYITKTKVTQKYNAPFDETFPFEYFKVLTNEGNGVMHILYRGDYLPYNYIVDNWQEIHNSWHINIQLMDLNDIKKCGGYVVSQYVGGQGTSYVRSSQSYKWVFKGYKGLWNNMKRDYPEECIKLWNNILKNRANKYFIKQQNLDDVVIYEDGSEFSRLAEKITPKETKMTGKGIQYKYRTKNGMFIKNMGYS